MYLIQIYYALTTGITGEKGNQHRRASWIGGLHILIYSFREYVFSFSLSKQLISKMVNFKHCNELKKHDFFFSCHKHGTSKETWVPMLMWNIMADLWIPCSSKLQGIPYFSVAQWQWTQSLGFILSWEYLFHCFTELMRTVVYHR